MLFEKLSSDDQVRGNELSIWPERPLVQKQMSVALFNQTRCPGLGSPCAVQLFLEEKRKLIRIRQRNYLHVAALVGGLHAVRLQPRAQRDVLRVAHLRGCDLFAMKIFGLLNSGIVAHYQR